MRDLNTKEILELLWKNKFLIIALSILGAILGYIYNNNFTKPQYTASSKIILSVTQSVEDNTYENPRSLAVKTNNARASASRSSKH